VTSPWTPTAGQKPTAAQFSSIIPVMAYKASDQGLATLSTTLQNVTSMSWSLTASAVYLFDLVFMFNAGITPDIKIGWTVPTSTTMNWGGIFPDTAGTYSAVAGLTESSTQAIGGAGAARQGRFAGLITVSTTAGTLQLQSRPEHLRRGDDLRAHRHPRHPHPGHLRGGGRWPVTTPTSRTYRPGRSAPHERRRRSW
jgi:hypothetical protein